jgi:acetyl esterase
MERKINEIDYNRRLDKDLRQYISKVQEITDNDAGTDLTKIRTSYDRVCDTFKVSTPPEVKIETNSFNTKEKKINFRVYEKDPEENVQILYAHGGGFIMGGLESHNDICAEICYETGLTVTAVDYRLSPEHRHPAAFDDVLDIYQSLNKKTPVILVGDSAGGTLVSMLATHLKGSDRTLKGQVLIYPYLGGNMKAGSYKEHALAPCLTKSNMEFYLNSWLDKNCNSVKLPLDETDFSNLPPTVVFTASDDPLNSDGVDYVNKIKQSKGKAIHFEGKGLVHGFLRARHSAEKARISFSKITEVLTLLAKTDDLPD